MKDESLNFTEKEKRFEEEASLWLRCSQGDDAARDALILAYRPMVYWLAKKLRVPYSTYPDMIHGRSYLRSRRV